MPRRRIRSALAVLTAALLTMAAAGAAEASTCPDPNAGPPYSFTTELVGQFGTPIPLKNMALLSRTTHGYVYRAGQQNSHLTITESGGRIELVDTGTAKWKSAVPGSCTQLSVPKGVAASCEVPAGVSESQPLLLEVWPRLGDDYVDGHTLPATVSLSVLADAGHDVARLGAGRDFFNGYKGHDRVSGGAGNDWLRPGVDSNVGRGGPGNDYIVGQGGADTLYGGSGDDRVYGSDGADHIYPGTGQDHVSCGTGTDTAVIDALDFAARDCESVTQ